MSDNLGINKLVPDPQRITYQIQRLVRNRHNSTLRIKYIMHFDGHGSKDKDAKVYDACGGEFWGKLCKKVNWNVFGPGPGLCIEHWVRNAGSTDTDKRCHTKIEACLTDIDESLLECRESGGDALRSLSDLILRKLPGLVEEIDPNFNPQSDCHVKHTIPAKEASQTSDKANTDADVDDDAKDEDDEDESSPSETETDEDEDESEDGDGDADMTGNEKKAGRV